MAIRHMGGDIEAEGNGRFSGSKEGKENSQPLEESSSTLLSQGATGKAATIVM